MNLLPTHWAATNQVVARNRRIGVSLSGLADFLNMINETDFTDLMGDAYRNVRAVNTRLAAEAGIPASIRVTTVKPSGSISLLTGVSPGLHYPTHSYCIRRVRVGEHTPIAKFLVKAGMPFEKDVYSDNTYVFSFPIDQSVTRPATQVSMWQQSFRLIYMQGPLGRQLRQRHHLLQPGDRGQGSRGTAAGDEPARQVGAASCHTPRRASTRNRRSRVSTEDTYVRMVAELPRSTGSSSATRPRAWPMMPSWNAMRRRNLYPLNFFSPKIFFFSTKKNIFFSTKKNIFLLHQKK